MSAPIRFIGLGLIAWMGVRAATLGLLPGFTVGYAKSPPRSPPPSVVATQFAPLPPVELALDQQWLAADSLPSYPVSAAPTRVPAPYYAPYRNRASTASIPEPIPPRPRWQLASSQADSPYFYTPIRPIDDWPISQMAPASFPQRRSSPVPPVLAQGPARAPLDRIQMSSWALLRGPPGPGGLAAGGTLGGSQAGARLTYAFNRWIAASLRTTSPVGGSRGAEVAGAIRLTPFRSIPVAITAERRQSISRHGGGRSAFALFAEGGLYRQPMPLNFSLDAYVQAGIVGLNSRDYFADGAFAFTRPVYGRFSAGFGIWGGV
jgi:hypothetical protein